MTVSIEEIEAMRNRRAEINHTPLDEIQWTKNGEVQSFEPYEIENWKFTGLSNVSFAEDKFIEPHIVQMILTKKPD